MKHFLARLIAPLRGEPPLYVPNWTPEKARKHERDTLRMLGRGDTAYQWHAHFKARKELEGTATPLVR